MTFRSCFALVPHANVQNLLLMVNQLEKRHHTTTYTNCGIPEFRCRFFNFGKGKLHEDELEGFVVITTMMAMIKHRWK